MEVKHLLIENPNPRTDKEERGMSKYNTSITCPSKFKSQRFQASRYEKDGRDWKKKRPPDLWSLTMFSLLPASLIKQLHPILSNSFHIRVCSFSCAPASSNCSLGPKTSGKRIQFKDLQKISKNLRQSPSQEEIHVRN